MVRKLRIGLLLYNDDVGVVYYIQNLVKAVYTLEGEERPTFVLFYTKSTEKHLGLFSDFEDIQKEKMQRFSLLRLYIHTIIFLRNPLKRLASDYVLDGLFPVLDIPLKLQKDKTKWVSWVTDFQHKHYPEYFSFKNRFFRDLRFKGVLSHANAIVLSSQSSYRDLCTFYPKFKGKAAVLNFVSEADTRLMDLGMILNKYEIKREFFLISNQFYKHKNHKVVFDAINQLDKEIWKECDFIFTGKTEDYRDPKYFPSLMTFIDQLGIDGSFKILGLIPREEQLLLMKNCIAIIQPSLFEGWNTSIEDAKNLLVPVVCSGIDVHHEQMKGFGYYFDPTDPLSLIHSLELVMQDFRLGKAKRFPHNTFERKKKYGRDFMKLFEHEAKV